MKTLVILGLICGSAASAAPTYLTCEMTSPKATHSYEVAADEASQSVIFTDERGKVNRVPAIFTGTALIWKIPLVLDLYQRWEVSRTDMSADAQVIGNNGPAGDKFVGKCKIADAPKRAF